MMGCTGGVYVQRSDEWISSMCGVHGVAQRLVAQSITLRPLWLPLEARYCPGVSVL